MTSHGERIANARHLERRARNLARYQRRLARCRRGSANRAKAKAKVARAHRKVRNARADFLHRTTTQLVRGNDLIAIEDLAVKNMVRNRCLARAISGCGWGEFPRQLEYKCQRAGRRLVVTGRWYPSSKTCSACGFLLAGLPLRSGRGDARPAAPATTGTSTRPRTSLRQVLPQPGATRAMPAELMSDTWRPLRCNRPRNRNPGSRGLESPFFTAGSSQDATR